MAVSLRRGTKTTNSNLSARIRPGGLERLLERVLVPPVLPGTADVGREGVRVDDFRRVIALVAAAAVGFFPASLVIADVPAERWPLFLVAAAVVGAVVAGSFVLLPQHSRAASLGAAVNVFAISGLALLLGGYYHQLGLLFVLIVASHAVVHGVYPALVAAIAGALLVPFVVQAGAPINPTDPVYALIYLSGAALVPWTAGKLAQRRATALNEQVEVITATEREAVMILARAAEAKDHTTGDHVVRVGDICSQLAMRTGMSADEAENVRFAAMLHDVGKLHLPDTVLQKPGPLTPEEWEIVKQHTVWGERILGSSDGFELARRVARSHHENFDGSGYPDGLRAMNIPLAARIVRVADVFDALAHSRPYKEAWSVGRVLDEIRAGAGVRYDPDLAREMITLVESKAVVEKPGAVGVVEQVSLVGRRSLPRAV